MGGVFGEQLRQCRQDHGDPRLVVRPEDGLAVAGDDAVPEDGNHPLGGIDGVHVGAEHDGGSGGVARNADDDVSRVAAAQRGRIVDRRRQAEFVEPLDQILGHHRLPAGGAVQRGQGHKFIHDIELHRFVLS